MLQINVAKDFSRTPGGRVRSTGPASGEAFRELLLRKLRSNPQEVLEVELDGAEGYGSSFLEEAFGGLIRTEIYPPDEIFRRVQVSARSRRYQTYVVEIQKYMRDAARHLGR